MVSDTDADDALQQASVGMRCKNGSLDESKPVEAMSCLQYVGFPQQYQKLRKVETDEDLRRKAWNIGEMGAHSFNHDCDSPWTCDSRKCECKPTHGWLGIDLPSQRPTPQPTLHPTLLPTPIPSQRPTLEPTKVRTFAPTPAVSPGPTPKVNAMKACIPNASAGRCLYKGCFRFRYGPSTCKRFKCVCNPGYCSIQGGKCQKITGVDSLSVQSGVLVSDPSSNSDVSNMGQLDVGAVCALCICGGFLAWRRNRRAFVLQRPLLG